MDAIPPHNPYHVRVYGRHEPRDAARGGRAADRKRSVKMDRADKHAVRELCRWDDGGHSQYRASTRADEGRMPEHFKASEACIQTLNAEVDRVMARYQPHLAESDSDRRYTRVGGTIFTAMRSENAPVKLIEKLAGLMHKTFGVKMYGGLCEWDIGDFKSEWQELDRVARRRRMMDVIHTRTFQGVADLEHYCAVVIDTACGSNVILSGHAIGNPDVVTCACKLELSPRCIGKVPSPNTTLTAQIANVCAFPGGKGIGSELMRYVQMFCAEHGVSEVVCFVVRDEHDTQDLLRFYRLHGFQVESSGSACSDKHAKIRMTCEIPLWRAP